METVNYFFCLCLIIASAVQANPATTPTIEVSAEQLKIAAGESGSVTCTPGGNPLPIIQWRKYEGQIGTRTQTSGNTLAIRDAQGNDEGYYMCVGLLGAGVVAQKYVYVEIENVDSTTQGNPTAVAVSQQTISIPRGGRGTVECIPQGNPLPRIQWTKSDGDLRREISSNGNTLVISDAREEDEGDYVCQGIVDGTVMVTDFLRVIIERGSQRPPQRNLRLIVSERELRIPEGGTGTIECTPEGDPLPKVQWIKSNGEFSDRIRPSGNTLVFSDFRVEDRGHFTCQGIVDGTVMLTNYSAVDIERGSQRPPQRNMRLIVSERELRIPEGGTGTIVCTPEGDPLPRVQWIKSNGEFSDRIRPSGNTLIFSDFRVEDRGHFTCQGIVDGTVMLTNYSAVDIERGPQRPPQRNLRLIVSERELRIPEGGTGTIECTPEGDPLPKVQWIKANGEFSDRIRQSGNTLIFSDFRVEDRGHFTCQGIVDGTVMLTNYSAVDIERGSQRPPQRNLRLIVSERELRIPEGGTGTIECTPEGDPLPRVQWIKANGEFSDRIRPSGNTLIFSDFRVEDRGHFTCQGIVDGTVMLTNYSAVDIERGSQRPPQRNLRLIVSERELRIPEGGTGTIECTPEGDPLPRVQWIKANGEFSDRIRPSGNTLIFSDFRVEDRGHFTCQGIVDGTVMLTNYSAVDIERGSQRPPQRNLRLIVSERELRIPEGGTGTIECTPEGDPLPTVQWIKSNGEFSDRIRPSGNTLIFSDFRVEDRGHFTCQGIVDGTVMLTNYSAVDIERGSQRPPQRNLRLIVSERELRIPEGGTGTIECTPEGDPLPRVQWIKSNGEFSDRIRPSGNMLIFSDFRVEDRGHFICQGIVDGTVMLTNYSAVDIARNEGRPDLLPKLIHLVISEGSDSTISCDFETGDLEQKVTWTRRDQRSLPQNAQVSGQELVIHSVTTEDSGEYLCKVTASRGGFLLRVAYVELEVLALPLVSVQPPAQTVHRGGAVTVECVVDGDAQVSWDRVDEPLSSRVESQGSRLYINGIEVEDAGYYRCSARNKAGISSGIAQVIVNDEPQTTPPVNLRSPNVVVSQKELTLRPGESVSIDCTPEGSPLPKVQWVKSNGEFRYGISQNGNSLIISDARKEDEAHYVCDGTVDGTVMATDFTAIRIEDEPQTASPANLGSPKVVVSKKQLTLRPGESGSIDCTPEGSPLPTVQWVKSNGEFRYGIRQNGNTLIISDARKEDQAHYVCQAFVDGTVMDTDFSAIYVQDEPQTAPPANLRSPKVVVSKKQLTLRPGESGSIDCTPEGSPLPTVQWVKSNGEFRSGIRKNGNTLIISDARKEDQAHYVCQAIVDGTVLDTDFSAIYIQSDERPPVVTGNSRVQINVRQLKIPKGGSRTAECTPEGNPLPTIQWSKHEGTFGVGTSQSGNALIISDAQEQDRGYYVCDGMVDGTAVWTDYLAVEIESNEASQLQSYPRVTVNVRQLRIPRGGTMAIECTPEGSPLPTIQWSKDGGNFSIGTRQSGNSLVINDAQEEDRGNYVCSAVVDGVPVFSDYLTVEIQYICELPQETGACRAAFERWYYDTTQQKCQKFIWGGCGGNKNNFETEEQCSLECERMRPNAA